MHRRNFLLTSSAAALAMALPRYWLTEALASEQWALPINEKLRVAWVLRSLDKYGFGLAGIAERFGVELAKEQPLHHLYNRVFELLFEQPRFLLWEQVNLLESIRFQLDAWFDEDNFKRHLGWLAQSDRPGSRTYLEILKSGTTVELRNLLNNMRQRGRILLIV